MKFFIFTQTTETGEGGSMSLSRLVLADNLIAAQTVLATHIREDFASTMDEPERWIEEYDDHFLPFFGR